MPATVVPVTICRLSGQLAADGCRGAVVFDENGAPTDRSMVYTEYFVRGTVPTMYCDLHPTHGIMTKIAGLFGQDHPAPPRVEDASIAPTPAPTATAGAGTATAAAASPPPPPPPEVKKKRGFWSRLFGVGKDKDKDRDKDKMGQDEQRQEQENNQPPPRKKSGG